jgi:hypothetical protein
MAQTEPRVSSVTFQLLLAINPELKTHVKMLNKFVKKTFKRFSLWYMFQQLGNSSLEILRTTLFGHFCQINDPEILFPRVFGMFEDTRPCNYNVICS